MSNISEKMKDLSKQDLIEIGSRLNSWNWDERLGNKPKDWDVIPNFMINEGYKLETKHKIMAPYVDYIESKTTEKERFKYHHMHNCHMTRLEHELWWINNRFQKIFRIGWYSKRNQAKLKNVLRKIADKNHEDYIQDTYSK
ncbi:hypothetical protein [Oceanobacillus sp. FSL H7-0719]|uniref:hypothetical protein n=1 Tax=Oceanobacillus sp. FSL H7-0719 TaxID=2954507 RepID=UPI0032492AF1